jgi:hypothetical protein
VDNGGQKIPDEIHQLIGNVAKELIRSGRSLTLDELTRALHRLSETAKDSAVRERSREIIALLLKRMH